MKCLVLACALTLLPVALCLIPVRKCCQQDEKLLILNSSEISLNDVKCVPTNGNHLFSHFSFSHPVFFGIPPQCKQIDVVDLSDKYFVTCVDNAEHVAKTVGLQCAQIPNFSFPVPRIDTLRKCCPKFRRYNSSSQSCWSGSKNLTVTAELIKIIFQNFTSGFADMSFGPPECLGNDVLMDMLVPKSQIWFQDSGSVLMRPLDVLHPILVVPEHMCVDLADDIDNTVIVRACQDYKVVCQIEGKPCVRKCCKDNESLFGKHCLQSRNVAHLQFHKLHYSDPIPEPYPRPAFRYGLNCEKYPLDPSDDGDQNFLLLNDSLFTPQMAHVNSQNYCIEHVINPSHGLNGTHAFICFGEAFGESNSTIINSPLYIVLFILMIMSCVCLFFTFLAYMYIPFLHGSLHGKTLMSHVASLLTAYICLTILQNETSLSDDVCEFLGYFLHYSFLAAFLWLNVISFDIWWTFGTIRSSIFKKAEEWRRFAMYSLYAWGFSGLMTFVTYFVDNHPGLVPQMWMPQMGAVSCFFSTQTYGLLIFFCGPVSIAFTINITLFILTAHYCYKTRTRLEKMAVTDPAKRKYRSDKSKLIVMGKLIVMMGLTWALEMISRLELLPSQVWYLSDLVNALQGFLIFISFVVKPQVLSSLATKLRSHQPSTSTMFTTAAASDSRICKTTSSRTSH